MCVCVCVCVCVGERQLKIRSHLCEGKMCCISLPSLQLFFHSGSTVCVCVCVCYVYARACVCVCVCYVHVCILPSPARCPTVARCDLISENETDTLSDAI